MRSDSGVSFEGDLGDEILLQLSAGLHPPHPCSQVGGQVALADAEFLNSIANRLLIGDWQQVFTAKIAK